jgi:hypothetical protein
MSCFLVADAATGAILRAGQVPESLIPLQAAEGQVAGEVPLHAIIPAIDMDAIRDFYCGRVDAAAVPHYPARTPAQAMKAAEAAGTAEPVILAAEAAATGADLADITAAVSARHRAYLKAFAAVESRRQGAKAAIRTAETFPAVLAAAAIDWTGETAHG